MTKYHVFFLYDVGEYLHARLSFDVEGKLFIPSHCEATTIFQPDELNRNKVQEIAAKIHSCSEATFETILKRFR